MRPTGPVLDTTGLHSNAGWVYKVLNLEFELRANLRWEGDEGNNSGYRVISNLSTPNILATNAHNMLNASTYHQLPPT